VIQWNWGSTWAYIAGMDVHHALISGPLWTEELHRAI